LELGNTTGADMGAWSWNIPGQGSSHWSVQNPGTSRWWARRRI